MIYAGSMARQVKTLRTILPVVLLVLAVFLFTRNPITGTYRLQMLLTALIAWGVYGYLLGKKGKEVWANPTFVFLGEAAILLLVGATGWFFSPFFFVLYLYSFFLALMYTPAVSTAFVLTLVILFSFNIGEVDLTYDFLVVLSLLTVLPLSLYLRKKYLSLKQLEKEILILKEKQNPDLSTVEEVLANKVSEVCVNLRQPVTDLKQLVYHLPDVRDKTDREKHWEQVRSLTEETIRIINGFEKQATGRQLMSGPKTAVPAPRTAGESDPT
ncbi:MAG: hypothetical protein UV58_C0018G0003 [Candidatus Wolfebacteria bacterium GW2011_GWC1_43_10]|uniref:Uncharacterized protein n=3 Tax=Patescibacteria group TaxID=1783273 RepID=A0A0G1C8D8_9BACT|nr:MAG: hypothetical protein UV58_C0018G0003 [Candidatus Wolfebacteria bacterium GW2011_GWC1_43_10]KKU95612.1 MAG: hypothetical protein UY28_C0047G0003 [Candidatus Amesbacteria bacterium GW2011_GWB1_48_13]